MAAQVEDQALALPELEEALRLAQHKAGEQRASVTQVQQQIQVLAAEMKYSANVLIALPLLVAAALALLNPGYLSVLFESELGLVVIGLQLMFMAIGYFIVQKMINFRV